MMRDLVRVAALVGVAFACVVVFWLLSLATFAFAGEVQVWDELPKPSGFYGLSRVYTDDELRYAPGWGKLTWHKASDNSTVTVQAHRFSLYDVSEDFTINNDEAYRVVGSANVANYTLNLGGNNGVDEYGAGSLSMQRVGNVTKQNGTRVMTPWRMQSMPFMWLHMTNHNLTQYPLQYGRFPAGMGDQIWAAGTVGSPVEDDIGAFGIGKAQVLSVNYAWHKEQNGQYKFRYACWEKVSGGVGSHDEIYADEQYVENGADPTGVWRDWYGQYQQYGKSAFSVFRLDNFVGVYTTNQTYAHEFWDSLGVNGTLAMSVVEGDVATVTAPVVPPSSPATPSLPTTWMSNIPTGTIFGGTEPSTTIVPQWLMDKLWTWYRDEVQAPVMNAMQMLGNLFWVLNLFGDVNAQ
ncbi:hypothetical protein CCP3SC15_1240010 [Gammaproteobacteria bacterium]